MNRLLKQALVEVATLPEDQQELVAARILDEVRRRRTPSKGRWARVADRLARLDALKGQSGAFAQHTRDFRGGFRLRDRPGA
jgi:hypothetical protein